MPINIAPNGVPPEMYALFNDLLRRAVDGTVTLPLGGELIYSPTNATTSGRKYRIQVIEVTDPDTQQISPVLQVVAI